MLVGCGGSDNTSTVSSSESTSIPTSTSTSLSTSSSKTTSTSTSKISSSEISTSVSTSIPASESTSASTSVPISRPDLKIIAPTGAPSIGLYGFASSSGFETNSVPANIIPSMKNGEKDVVILPTNAGINAIVKQNAPFKIAATITYGNVFVAKTGSDADGIMNEGDSIAILQKSNLPGLLFKSVYGEELYNSAIEVDASGAAYCLKTGKTLNNVAVDYVLIAEPAFTKVKGSDVSSYEYANIQKEYFKKYSLDIFQASVFVNNSTEKSKIDAFLNCLAEDIALGIANPTLIKEGMEVKEKPEVFFGTDPSNVYAATNNGNRLGLGYKAAKDNKEGIDNFLSLFGIDATTEEIYYK